MVPFAHAMGETKESEGLAIAADILPDAIWMLPCGGDPIDIGVLQIRADGLEISRRLPQFIQRLLRCFQQIDADAHGACHAEMDSEGQRDIRIPCDVSRAAGCFRHEETRKAFMEDHHIRRMRVVAAVDAVCVFDHAEIGPTAAGCAVFEQHVWMAFV